MFIWEKILLLKKTVLADLHIDTTSNDGLSASFMFTKTYHLCQTKFGKGARHLVQHESPVGVHKGHLEQEPFELENSCKSNRLYSVYAKYDRFEWLHRKPR